MKKKEITNEDLARMVANGFEKVNEEFQNVHSQLDDINSKLSNVAYRFELNELERRVEKCEGKLGLAKS